MKTLKKITLITSIILTTYQSTLASMLPKNDLRVPIRKNAHDENKSHQLIDQIEKVYTPIINEQRGHFFVTREWENERVNAAAGRSKDGQFQIKVFGGLYRYETISDDAFLLILCHEIGHLIGGAPTVKPFNNITSEGQADYFSTSKCFRRVVRGENHKQKANLSLVNPLAKRECLKVYPKNSEDYEICIRVNVANRDMANTIEDLNNLKRNTLKIETPDPYERMFIVFNGYPEPQCRLDTLFKGSLCRKNENSSLDLQVYNGNNCNVYEDQFGLRPLCWYVPRVDQ